MANKTEWAGRAITGLVGLVFIAAATGKVVTTPDLKALGEVGIPVTMIKPIAAIEFTCAALYLIPRTAVLGAVLLTGFIGGTILTHWRVDQNVVVQITLGLLIWAGIYLREPRLWQLLPLRKGTL